MVEFALPRNSKVKGGKSWSRPEGATNTRTFKIYRWSPDDEDNPQVDTYTVDMDTCGPIPHALFTADWVHVYMSPTCILHAAMCVYPILHGSMCMLSGSATGHWPLTGTTQWLTGQLARHLANHSSTG